LLLLSLVKSAVLNLNLVYYYKTLSLTLRVGSWLNGTLLRGLVSHRTRGSLKLLKLRRVLRLWLGFNTKAFLGDLYKVLLSSELIRTQLTSDCAAAVARS